MRFLFLGYRLGSALAPLVIELLARVEEASFARSVRADLDRL